MGIDEIEIKIKKYDREKEVVILNLIFCKQLEVRGFVVRLAETKTEPKHSFWSVNPPSIRAKNKSYFWIVQFLKIDFWTQIKEKIIEKVINYPGDI